jgi:cytosine/adenosine deaminase-related metal-dependent hydrolase
MYQGTRLSAAEALNAGITFVHDWCHNPRTPHHAEENLRALRESGIRARFSYGRKIVLPDVLHRLLHCCIRAAQRDERKIAATDSGLSAPGKERKRWRIKDAPLN